MLGRFDKAQIRNRRQGANAFEHLCLDTGMVRLQRLATNLWWIFTLSAVGFTVAFLVACFVRVPPKHEEGVLISGFWLLVLVLGAGSAFSRPRVLLNSGVTILLMTVGALGLYLRVSTLYDYGVIRRDLLELPRLLILPSLAILAINLIALGIHFAASKKAGSFRRGRSNSNSP